MLWIFPPLDGDAQPQSRDKNNTDIVLGMSAAFTGPSRSLGIELYRGASAYFQKVNAQGGVHGRRIRIKAYDDGYDPGPALENTIRLVNDDQVFALFGYVGTPTTTRILPLLEKHRDKPLLLFFPMTGAQPLREPPYRKSIFNLRASYFQETRRLVEGFLSIGRERIAVLYQADAYGRNGWAGVRRTLREYNLDIVGEATYRRGVTAQADMGEQVRLLRDANPDAVITVGAAPACAAFIRQARQQGWEVPIANLSFTHAQQMAKCLLEVKKGLAPEELTQNLLNAHVVPSLHDTRIPAVREYRQVMDAAQISLPRTAQSTLYTPHRYDYVSFEGFLNAKLLVQMLRRTTPPLTPQRVRQSIYTQRRYTIDIGLPLFFGPEYNQGLDIIFFSTLRNDHIEPLRNWDAFAP
ncbi:MAG: ABC transporter substrate-binding protein [Thermodesulfobacteriota bacterium]